MSGTLSAPLLQGDSRSQTRRALGFVGVLSLGLLVVCVVLLRGQGNPVELVGAVDWDKVPSARPLPEDYAGLLGEDGFVHPATCGQVCDMCYRGALRGNKEPGDYMQGESCMLCQCEKAQPPAWDSWNDDGTCTPELCFACQTGKLDGKACFECECGAWRGHKHLTDVCKHRSQVCYSCMVGTLMGPSCERCLCGWWDEGKMKEGENSFGPNDCAQTCHRCNIREATGVECDMCFCPVYDDLEVHEDYVPKSKDVEGALDEYEASLKRSKDTLEANIKALEAHKEQEDVPHAEEEHEEKEEHEEGNPWALPHYSWMTQ